MIEAIGVQKRYSQRFSCPARGRPAVRRGEGRWWIMGPSGSGKSTLSAPSNGPRKSFRKIDHDRRHRPLQRTCANIHLIRCEPAMASRLQTLFPPISPLLQNPASARLLVRKRRRAKWSGRPPPCWSASDIAEAGPASIQAKLSGGQAAAGGEVAAPLCMPRILPVR